MPAGPLLMNPEIRSKPHNEGSQIGIGQGRSERATGVARVAIGSTGRPPRLAAPPVRPQGP
jgi:hypothetical protein